LKRLLDEGRVETACRYRHLNTETGPGHSSLSTGAPPRVTGIVANQWFEPQPDGSILVVRAAHQATGTRAPSGQPAAIAGPGDLRVDTLGDRMVAADPGSRVVSVSGKDRSAVLLAGRNRAHTVYWYDTDTGRFVTSPAYAPPPESRDIVARFDGALRLPARF